MQSVTALLLLLGTVVGLHDATLEVRGPNLSALSPGDKGTVYYELGVGSELRRIDVGEG
jgi:hypothetical protein